MTMLGRSFAHATVANMPSEVRAALAAGEAEREAATEATALLLVRPDREDEDGPLVHGWALHAAFLAGVRWARTRR